MRKILTISTFLAMALLLVPMLVHSGDKKDDLVAQIQVLEARVLELEAKLQYVNIEDGVINGLRGPHIIIEGANLHVRSGQTYGINGRGNLIIGYNNDEEIPSDDEARTASHVVVIGDQHRYTSNGGLVAGYMNTISGDGATVTCGQQNIAEGWNSSVSGGSENVAKGRNASISGGAENVANENNSSVSGGFQNNARGLFSSVTGGYMNQAIGQNSVVSGGDSCSAEGDSSTVSGGWGAGTDGSRDWAAGEWRGEYYYDNDAL
jgi:hypothetical protein